MSRAIELADEIDLWDPTAGGLLSKTVAELRRLDAIVNAPQADDFLRAVSTEAEHQRQRWGNEHDAGKTPAVEQKPVGYMNAGHVHEMQQKRIPYAYVYPDEGPGAHVAVYTTPQPEQVAQDSELLQWLIDNSATYTSPKVPIQLIVQNGAAGYREGLRDAMAAARTRGDGGDSV